MPVTGFTPDASPPPQGGVSFTPDASSDKQGGAQFTPDQPPQDTRNWLQRANASPAGKFASGIVGNVGKNIAYSMRDTLQTGLDTLQIPARFAGGVENPDQPGGNLVQGNIGSLGRGLVNLFNVSRGNADMEQTANYLQALIPAHEKTQGIPKFLEHFAAQMVQDPTSVIPFAVNGAKVAAATEFAHLVRDGAVKVGAKIPGLERATKVGEALTEAHKKSIGTVYNHFLGGRPELDSSLDASGKTLRLGTEIRNSTKMKDELGKSDKNLLKRLDPQLKSVKAGEDVPEELRQRTLQEAWRYGDDRARRDAVELGYRKTPEDAPWEKGPENLLSYPHGLRKDYEFTGDITKKIPTLPAFAAHEARYGKRTASFEYERKQHALEDLEEDRRKRWEIRLRMGRDMVRKRRVDHETEQLLTKYGGWNGHEALAQKIEDAEKSHADAISNLQKQAAMFRSSPEAARGGALKAMERELADLKANKVMDSAAVEKYAALEQKIRSVKARDPMANAAYFAERAKKAEDQAAELKKNTPTHEQVVAQQTNQHIHDLVTGLSHSHYVAWKDYNLRWLSNAGKRAITGSVFPHLFGNLGSFASWRGGIPVVVNGIRKMLPEAPGRAVALFNTGTPQELVNRLKAGGGYHEFDNAFENAVVDRLKNMPGTAGRIGSGAERIMEIPQAILNRGETALRAALLQSLDKELGPSKNAAEEFAKMQTIRDTIADTHNPNAFVSLLEAMGAPFANFIGSTVHAAVKTAMSPNAYRLTVPLRLQHDMDQDRQDFGGLQMMNPAITVSHLLGSGAFSESHAGPIPGLLQFLFGALSGHPQIPNPINKTMEMVQDYGGPLTSRIPAFFSEPYAAPGLHHGDPNPEEALLNFFTGFFHANPKSHRTDKYIERAAGRASGL